MKPIEDSINAEKFLNNLPIGRPTVITSSRDVNSTDNGKLILFSGSNLDLTLVNTLTKDCFFVAMDLSASSGNAVVASNNTFDLNTKTLYPVGDIRFSEYVSRIDCFYLASANKWYVFKHQEFVGRAVGMESMMMEDTAQMILDPGLIGWNMMTFNWVEHDGNLIGGNPVGRTFSATGVSKGGRVIKGIEFVSQQALKLDWFLVRAPHAVAGAKFRASGSFCVVAQDPGDRPNVMYIGVSTNSATAFGALIGNDLAPGTTKLQRADFVLEFMLQQLPAPNAHKFRLVATDFMSGGSKLQGATLNGIIVSGTLTLINGDAQGLLDDDFYLTVDFHSAALAGAEDVGISWDIKIENIS